MAPQRVIIDNLHLAAQDLHDYILEPDNSTIVLELMTQMQAMEVSTAAMLLDATRKPVALLEIFSRFLVQQPSNEILRILLLRLPAYRHENDMLYLTEIVLKRLNELFLEKAVKTLRDNRMNHSAVLDNLLRKRFHSKDDNNDNIYEL